MTCFSKKIAGIVLAAGSGSRMGKTKQLLPFGDTTLLGRVIFQALASQLESVTVVLGHDAEKIRRHIAGQFDLSRINIIVNKNFRYGQSTSLIAGITHLPSGIDGAMFLLGDLPLITPEIINHLIAAFQNSGALIAIPFYEKKRGNPVIISRVLFPQLNTLTADTGARVLFEKHKPDILKVPVNDAAIVTDIDTPDDYKKLISQQP